MNRAFLIILLSMFACNQNRPENKEGIKELAGLWLSDNYLKSIEVSRSIYASRDYATSFWGFSLDKKNLMSDSALLNGFTEHEGGYSCFLHYNINKSLFEHDLSKDSEFSHLSGIPFELHLVDSNKLELKTDKQREIYRKISNEQSVLREILFVGKYQDLKNDNQTIEFKKDGQITGIKGRQYFDLIYDFGEGIEYDACIFYKDNFTSGDWRSGDMYNFKINGDTLTLLRLKTDWDEMNHQIGDIEYLLKRL